MSTNHVGFVRILVTAVVICIGVAGGLLIGYKLLGVTVEPEEVEASPAFDEEKARQNPLPTVGAGDLFPPLALAEPSDTTQTLFDIVYGQPTVLIIIGAGCRPCENLLWYWKTQIEPHQSENVRLILARPDYTRPFDSDEAELVADRPFVVYRGHEARDLCNIRALPTVFTIDAQGFIQHVQLGFDDILDYQIHKFATR